MRQAIAVLNAGSSSLKFALFLLRPGQDRARRDPVLLLRGQIEGIGRAPRLLLDRRRPIAFVAPSARAVAEKAADHAGALDLLLDWFEEDQAGITVAAAGHRVVHGGAAHGAPERVTPGLIAALAALEPLAPQHQPHNVAAIRALAERRPGLPQVACFDTAFHATQPPVATILPLPRELGARGLRRYGFHGLSYEYVLSALPAYTATPDVPGRLVIAHLGNGCSMCAVEDGHSIATTMGFSALDGLTMGTRCGALDPGVLLYLMREEGLDLAGLTDLLYNRSGLLGVSGISADMRRLLDSGRPEAAEAVELFCYRIGRALGSLAAALGGLDALVFTGGIGENAAEIRTRVCDGARWLGVEVDEAANVAGGPLISRPFSPVSAWVVPTNEELVIARHARALVA